MHLNVKLGNKSLDTLCCDTPWGQTFFSSLRTFSHVTDIECTFSWFWPHLGHYLAGRKSQDDTTDTKYTLDLKPAKGKCDNGDM